MTDDLSIGEIARKLADNAEAFCGDYLSGGTKVGGNRWTCGDVTGAAGASMSVHLHGPRAGKWTDYNGGEHGDLLDLLEHRLGTKRAAIEEARSWLRLPRRESPVPLVRGRNAPQSDTPGEERARRLWAMGRSIAGTPAAAYLASRRIELAETDTRWLRYMPTCFYRDGVDGPPDKRPALLCAITDLDGTVVGVSRIYLSPSGTIADVADPKKVLGRIYRCAVRFGVPGDLQVAGEGVETMLSIKTALPHMPIAACLTATHLRVYDPPASLRELWIARDAGTPGETAAEDLKARLASERPDLRVEVLKPRGGDFNDRLIRMGKARLARRMGEIMGPSADAILPAAASEDR